MHHIVVMVMDSCIEYFTIGRLFERHGIENRKSGSLSSGFGMG